MSLYKLYINIFQYKVCAIFIFTCFIIKVGEKLKINQIKSFISHNLLKKTEAVLPSSDKKYYLIEKLENMPIKKFPRDSWAIPQDAVTFKQVKIGKTKDSEYRRNIISFYDKEHKIIRQFQSGTEIPHTCKEYSYSDNLTKDEELVHVKKIHTAKYLPIDGYPDWHDTSDVEQFIHTDLNKLKKHNFARKVTIKRTKYNLASLGKKFTTVFTEYPFNLGFEPKKSLKILGADIEIKNGIPYISGTIESPTVKFPEDDKFIAFRFLEKEQKQESLTKYFLKQKGLERANIEVETGEGLVPENAAAVFTHGYGSIYFKHIPQFTSPAKSAGHETEHAYQYSLIGRLLCGADSEYEKRCFRTFGKLPSITKIKEAEKYADAKAKYPKIDDIENLSENKEYMNNLLEVKAREAGKKASEDYEFGHKFLLDQFKYVPNNYYYF